MYLPILLNTYQGFSFIKESWNVVDIPFLRELY